MTLNVKKALLQENSYGGGVNVLKFVEVMSDLAQNKGTDDHLQT